MKSPSNHSAIPVAGNKDIFQLHESSRGPTIAKRAVLTNCSFCDRSISGALTRPNMSLFPATGIRHLSKIDDLQGILTLRKGTHLSQNGVSEDVY